MARKRASARGNKIIDAANERMMVLTKDEWEARTEGRFAPNLRLKGDFEKRNALHEQNALSSHGLHRSTFGEEGLNYRVRNGIG